ARMKAPFRVGVAGEFATFLMVDELAEPVEKAARLVLDAGFEQVVPQPQFGEFPHRMGQEGDAHAQFLDLRRPLIDAAGDAAPMQVERQGKAANTGADDTDFHRYCSVTCLL